MKKVMFTWNGTKSQERDYAESVRRTNKKREKRNRRDDLLLKYQIRAEIEQAKREEFWEGYFREAV